MNDIVKITFKSHFKLSTTHCMLYDDYVTQNIQIIISLKPKATTVVNKVDATYGSELYGKFLNSFIYKRLYYYFFFVFFFFIFILS